MPGTEGELVARDTGQVIVVGGDAEVMSDWGGAVRCKYASRPEGVAR